LELWELSPSNLDKGKAAPEPSAWFLGLDLAHDGLTAVLADRSRQKIYPLCWMIPEVPGMVDTPEMGYQDRSKSHWFLPAIAHFASGAMDSDSYPPEPIAVGLAQVPLSPEHSHPASSSPLDLSLDDSSLKSTNPPPILTLSTIKPFLDLGLPFFSPRNQTWEPRLHSLPGHSPPESTSPGDSPTPQSSLPLIWIRKALEGLLLTLNPQQWVSQDSSGDEEPKLPHDHWQGKWQCKALDLPDSVLHQALSNLMGIVVSCPHASAAIGSVMGGEAYRFNWREAILAAQLVEQPDQIFFLEEGIAAFLAELHPSREATFPALWQNGTLTFKLGAYSTQLALVQFPKSVKALKRSDFGQGSLDYGTQALDQDIVSQLLAPLLPIGRLQVDQWAFPEPGTSAPSQRWQLQTQLHSTALGRLLLETAAQLRQVLQSQSQFTLRIGSNTHILSRDDFATKVIQPYIQQLNSCFNDLMAQIGVAQVGITQVLYTGDLDLPPNLLRWLHQKLPQARLIQDRGPNLPGAAASGSQTNTAPMIWAKQRIAYGLATLPSYPQLLETRESQYSDMFLFLELMRVWPNHALGLSDILEYLEQRGINSRHCRSRIVALLQGTLPQGLIPPATDWGYFISDSWQSPDYTTLRSPELFTQLDNGDYDLEPRQRQNFLDYWQAIATHTIQTLTEPLFPQIASQTNLI
jgi:hypothetical protein